MEIKDTAINTIRVLSMEGVEKANSGHPGLPMGAAPAAFELWANHMNHNPKNPDWINRDRFVLSAGHGSMLLYSLLFLFGYDVSKEDLMNFRQWDCLKLQLLTYRILYRNFGMLSTGKSNGCMKRAGESKIPPQVNCGQTLNHSEAKPLSQAVRRFFQQQ